MPWLKSKIMMLATDCKKASQKKTDWKKHLRRKQFGRNQLGRKKWETNEEKQDYDVISGLEAKKVMMMIQQMTHAIWICLCQEDWMWLIHWQIIGKPVHELVSSKSLYVTRGMIFFFFFFLFLFFILIFYYFLFIYFC